MKSLTQLLNEAIKKMPVVGKSYKDENGDKWKIEEFKEYAPGELAEEDYNNILDAYDYGQELSEIISSGYYDDEDVILVGASKGNKKKAFVWGDDEILYIKKSSI